ncbi:hypothetical protein KFU94_39830 [Chloroflexi bacterium TSY]|nr:hypothetical protein [Chloroflexi bacterium TSY]
MSIVQATLDARNSLAQRSPYPSRTHLNRLWLALVVAAVMFAAPLVAATSLDAEIVNELPGINVALAEECEGTTCG